MHSWSHHYRRLCSQPSILRLLSTRTIMTQPLKSARSGRPTFSIRQVAPRLGGRRIRSRLGTIWQLLPVPRRAPNLLKIRWIRCTKFDIYVVFQGLIKNSKSVDFRLSSPGFATHSPTLATLLVRTVPRPWFNCSARPRLVPSLSRVQRFFVQSLDCSGFTPSPRCPSSATSRQISKQPAAPANHSHPQCRPAPTIFSARVLSGTSRYVTNPQPEIPEQMG